MARPLPKELTHARELKDLGKFGEALEIIDQYEKEKSFGQEDLLSLLILKGKIFINKRQYKDAGKMGQLAYQISQKLEDISNSIEALLLQSYGGGRDKALELIFEAEKLIKFLNEKSDTSRQEADILYRKSWIYLFKDDYSKALEIALRCLELREITGNKSNLAAIFRTIAAIHLREGDYGQALQYCKQGLSIKDVTKRIKLDVLKTLATIYFLKGKVRQAINYTQEVVILARELNLKSQLIQYLNDLGYFYKVVGKNDLAIESFNRALLFSENLGILHPMARSLMLLVNIHFDKKSREKAEQYFSRLTELYNQTKNREDIDLSYLYLYAKAYMKKMGLRMRDHVEAQALFKELISQKLNDPGYRNDLIIFMASLCDLLLEELSIYNTPEIMDEIIPLITKSLEIAETARNYFWLAETKLLQAKLALIQLEHVKAKILLGEAQQIAEEHGLKLLAQKISNEYDLLLEKADEWDKLNLEDAPMADRIELASFDGVINRLHGKQAVDPPELVEEEPILLLIMDNSGATYFNHPFIADWDYSDLFSDFMSAFNTFSSEIFSSSIDRIKVKENTILIHSVESFLVCYVIKGQSYPALQKLTKFTEAIRENSEIWQALNKSIKTSEVLELDKPPALKTVIDEIFT